MRALILITSALMVVGAPPSAHADPDAEALKQAGIKAARAKDWELARSKFEQAYALGKDPLNLYNLANAQEQTDQLLAARASYVRFLDSGAPGENERFRKFARGRLAQLVKDIPTLQIKLSGFVASVVVELDGRALPASELDVPVPLDPGEHVVVALRGTEELARRPVMVSRGSRQATELVAPPPKVVEPPPSPIVTPAAPAAPPPARASSGGVLSSGWFWLATSVVVLGGAGAGYYYVIRDAPQAEPTPGTLGGVVVVR